MTWVLIVLAVLFLAVIFHERLIVWEKNRKASEALHQRDRIGL